MSKVSLAGNASGTGIFTIASPNSNTDRTLTLPDQTGTLLSSSAQGIPKSALPTGSVLQVVSVAYSGASGTASSSETATGRYVDITPTSATSKIFIIFTGTSYKEGGAGKYYLYRNGSTKLTTSQIGASLTFYQPGAVSYLDSPATTSSVRYELYMSNDSGALIYWPPGGSDIAVCTAMEIAA